MASNTRVNTHVLYGEWHITADSFLTSFTRLAVFVTLVSKSNALDKQLTQDLLNSLLNTFEVVGDLKLSMAQLEKSARHALMEVTTQFTNVPPIMEHAITYFKNSLSALIADIPGILRRISELESAIQNLADNSK